MNALTLEWIDKAEGDFRTATRETRVRKSPNYDESLNKYAVSVRYPGESATKEDARNALSAMKTVRAFVRQKLGL